MELPLDVNTCLRDSCTNANALEAGILSTMMMGRGTSIAAPRNL